MTEFEEKKLEELRKQHEEYLNYLKQKDEEYLKYLKQCDIENRIKEEEQQKATTKFGLIYVGIIIVPLLIFFLSYLL